MGDDRLDMDWKLDLLTHLYTPLGTASNYSAIASLFTLQITAAPVKHFSSMMCFQQPFPTNGFYQWTFFSFPQLLSSEYITTEITQPAWGPRYIASGRT
jgi:hypothetical protein